MENYPLCAVDLAAAAAQRESPILRYVWDDLALPKEWI